MNGYFFHALIMCSSMENPHGIYMENTKSDWQGGKSMLNWK